MATIKTTLRTVATDDAGNLKLNGTKAFSDVLTLGLLAGTRDRDTKAFATDETGLHALKEWFSYLQFDCFSGLQGIGALIMAANPERLTKDNFEQIGGLMWNLSQLGIEASSCLEDVEKDEQKREEDALYRQQSGSPPKRLSVPTVALWLMESFNFSAATAATEAERLLKIKTGKTRKAPAQPVKQGGRDEQA